MIFAAPAREHGRQGRSRVQKKDRAQVYSRSSRPHTRLGHLVQRRGVQDAPHCSPSTRALCRRPPRSPPPPSARRRALHLAPHRGRRRGAMAAPNATAGAGHESERRPSSLLISAPPRRCGGRFAGKESGRDDSIRRPEDDQHGPRNSGPHGHRHRRWVAGNRYARDRAEAAGGRRPRGDHSARGRKPRSRRHATSCPRRPAARCTRWWPTCRWPPTSSGLARAAAGRALWGPSTILVNNAGQMYSGPLRGDDGRRPAPRSSRPSCSGFMRARSAASSTGMRARRWGPGIVKHDRRRRQRSPIPTCSAAASPHSAPAQRHQGAVHRALGPDKTCWSMPSVPGWGRHWDVGAAIARGPRRRAGRPAPRTKARRLGRAQETRSAAGAGRRSWRTPSSFLVLPSARASSTGVALNVDGGRLKSLW